MSLPHKAALATVRKDILVASRQLTDLANLLFFFILSTLLIPFGVGNDLDILRAIAPGIIWVMALLSTLLSLDRLFHRDAENGSLDQIILCASSYPLIILAKVLVHWLLSGAVISVVSPMLGLMLSLPLAGVLPLFMSLMIGSFALTCLGSIGAAMTLSLGRANILLNLIVMPLYVPVLIYGAGVVRNAANGIGYAAPLQMLCAISLLSFVLAALSVPWLLKAGRAYN